eukprot:455078-Rhodomonas_salina.2
MSGTKTGPRYYQAPSTTQHIRQLMSLRPWYPSPYAPTLAGSPLLSQTMLLPIHPFPTRRPVLRQAWLLPCAYAKSRTDTAS